MNLKSLQALRAFVDAGSLVEAANRLGRTQPQVSRLLSALEKDTGLRLFDRKGRRLQLTSSGQAFYFLVQHTLNNFEELETAARRLRDGDELHISILTAPHLTGAMIAGPLAEMMTRHTAFTATVDSRARVDIDQWLGRENFDLAVAVLPVHSPLVDVEPFLSASVVAAMDASHPLSGAAQITVEDAAHNMVIGTSHRSILRQAVDRAFVAEGRQFQPRVVTPNGVVACQLTTRGIGLTLADPFVALSSASPGMVFRPFVPEITLEYGFLYPRWKPRAQITVAFSEMIAAHSQSTLRQLQLDMQTAGAPRSNGKIQV